MRWILPLILVAGCSNSNPAPADMAMTMSTRDMSTTSCSQTVDAYCTAGSCVRDLASAQSPASWCPDGGTATGAVTLSHCSGGQTVIVAQYSDSASTFVYASGALVAVLTSVPHSQELVCLAGPATFATPGGCDAPTTLCAG